MIAQVLPAPSSPANATDGDASRDASRNHSRCTGWLRRPDRFSAKIGPRTSPTSLVAQGTLAAAYSLIVTWEKSATARRLDPPGFMAAHNSR